MSLENEDTNEELKQELEQPLDEIKEEEDAPLENSLEETEEDIKPEDIKSKAKATGHKTLEEFVAAGGKAEDYKTEKEFVLTGELIDLKKTIQKRDRDIEEILKYNKSVIQEHKRKMRQELESRLAEAENIGDVDSIKKLSIEKYKQETEEQVENTNLKSQEVKEVDDSFLENNSNWYNQQHPELISRCSEVAERIKLQIPNITYRQLASEVEKQMKFELGRSDQYAHLVIDTSKVSRPQVSATKSAVTQSGTTSNQSDDKLYTKLSNTEKSMYNSAKRMASKVGATLSVNEFIEQMNEDREI